MTSCGTVDVAGVASISILVICLTFLLSIQFQYTVSYLREVGYLEGDSSALQCTSYSLGYFLGAVQVIVISSGRVEMESRELRSFLSFLEDVELAFVTLLGLVVRTGGAAATLA